jgi:hypothetical protein
MAKYRKKPIIIEAVQFDHTKFHWPEGVHAWPHPEGYQPRDMSWGYIDTLEGVMGVMDGDWIITGVAGEKYPCKDAIFKATYDPVEDNIS